MTTFLIVDDEASNRYLLKQILEYAGYSAIEAADGDEALQLLSLHPVDVAIVDLNMPVLNGPAFIKEARSKRRLKALPIILYTATPDNMAIRAFMETFGIRH